MYLSNTAVTPVLRGETMESAKCKEQLFQRIEVLRNKLHRQKDLTRRDTLEVSMELDRLILEAMKNGSPNKN